jgi:hypothetical protein
MAKVRIIFDLLTYFDLGDVGTMFLRNVGSLSTDYTALYLITAVRNSNLDKIFAHKASCIQE